VQSLDTEGIWRQISELSLEIADHEEYPDEAQESRKQRLAIMQKDAVAQTRSLDRLVAQDEKTKPVVDQCLLANLRVVEDGRIIITTKAYRMVDFLLFYISGAFCQLLWIGSVCARVFAM